MSGWLMVKEDRWKKKRRSGRLDPHRKTIRSHPAGEKIKGLTPPASIRTYLPSPLEAYADAHRQAEAVAGLG